MALRPGIPRALRLTTRAPACLRFYSSPSSPSPSRTSSGSSSRRLPPTSSHPVPGHLPNKPDSGFLSDLDDCFFDRMRVWTDADSKELSGIPTFRIVDGQGKVVGTEAEEMIQDLTKEEALKIYHYMSLLPQLDQILYSAQRQGRISFWMTSYGEEATIIGTASALAHNDEIYSQYRELGLLLYRGCPLETLLAQVMGTKGDKGKGRQMPTHIGNTDFYFQTISSPLATQLPQAAGAAYALKRTPGRESNVVGCWFGEGSASEGDFHAGLNFASTLDCPVLWLARNNGFAISTASTDQYRGDGIASRGPGYGTLTIRVDGNDVLAVRVAVEEARRRAAEGSRPVLIEFMTYRVGSHSTSDDSGTYRPKSSVDEWSKMDNPLHRFRSFLRSRKWWSTTEEEALVASRRQNILSALSKVEKQPLPALDTLFEDTWAPGNQPKILLDQKREMKRLVDKYGEDWEPWKQALARVEGGKDGLTIGPDSKEDR